MFFGDEGDPADLDETWPDAEATPQHAEHAGQEEQTADKAGTPDHPDNSNKSVARPSGGWVLVDGEPIDRASSVILEVGSYGGQVQQGGADAVNADHANHDCASASRSGSANMGQQQHTDSGGESLNQTAEAEAGAGGKEEGFEMDGLDDDNLSRGQRVQDKRWQADPVKHLAPQFRGLTVRGWQLEVTGQSLVRNLSVLAPMLHPLVVKFASHCAACTANAWPVFR